MGVSDVGNPSIVALDVTHVWGTCAGFATVFGAPQGTVCRTTVRYQRGYVIGRKSGTGRSVVLVPVGVIRPDPECRPTADSAPSVRAIVFLRIDKVVDEEKLKIIFGSVPWLREKGSVATRKDKMGIDRGGPVASSPVGREQGLGTEHGRPSGWTDVVSVTTPLRVPVVPANAAAFGQRRARIVTTATATRNGRGKAPLKYRSRGKEAKNRDRIQTVRRAGNESDAKKLGRTRNVRRVRDASERMRL